MTPIVRLAVLTLLAGASAPLAAQSRPDPVRLDDFSVAARTDDPSHIEQLPHDGAGLGGSPAPKDRTVVAEAPSSPPKAALPQLSSSDEGTEQTQLSKPGARPDESLAAVSTPAQSRPQGVVRIAGHDHCDPQLAGADLEKCRRILELRAQEFDAPEAPRLSAEQTLLARQRSAEESARRSTEARLRLATRDEPDADLASNQELAALYLDKQAPPDTPAASAQEVPTDPKLAQILDTLQIQASGLAVMP